MFSIPRSELVTETPRATNVQSLPDVGAGERISIQPLSDPETAHRDRACALPYRETDKDMVSEQAHEAQEGATTDKRSERNGKTRPEGRRHDQPRRRRRRRLRRGQIETLRCIPLVDKTNNKTDIQFFSA